MAVQPVLVSERDLDGLIANHLDGPKPAPRPVLRRAPPPPPPHHAAPFALVPFPSGLN